MVTKGGTRCCAHCKGGLRPRLREGFPEEAKTESRSEKQQGLTGQGQERSILDEGSKGTAARGHSKAPGRGRVREQRTGLHLGRLGGLGRILFLLRTVRRDGWVWEVDTKKRA